MASTKTAVESDVTYEDLILLESEFHKVDNEILRRQWTLAKPLYEKRKQLALRIPHFWPLVFEEAPPEIDHYIQPSDSAVFADCLLNVEVERFEIDTEPRSFLLRFEFGSNKWFEDKILQKRFWYRRSNGNWQGLISEPVKIRWKKGHDLSNGITDASVALWAAFKASGNPSTEGLQKLKGTAEYKSLAQKLENSDLSASSFFTLFAFISAFRYVDEKESQQAYEAEADRRQKRKQGERVEEPEDDLGLVEDDEIMVCPHGEDLAQVIADDLYPNAIKYFITAQDREEMSEDDSEDQDEDMESDVSGMEAELNIRSLVSGKSHNKRRQENSISASPPPSSKVRTGA